MYCIEQLYPKDNSKQTFIFAINSPMDKAEELCYVKGALHHCSVKQVQGCYNDMIEVAYVIHTNSELAVDEMHDLCKDHGQESILCLDAKRGASLFYLATGILSDIGKFREVSANEALDSGDWTRDGSTFYRVK